MTEFAAPHPNELVHRAEAPQLMGAVATESGLQLRGEHSRSLEQANVLKAMHDLTELGLFTPVSSLDFYHGRVDTEEGHRQWSVDPDFSNGSNDTGNNNVNTRSSLYASSRDVAEEFATERKQETVFSRRFKKIRDAIAQEDPMPYREADYQRKLALHKERLNNPQQNVIWHEPKREDSVFEGPWQPHELIREARAKLEAMTDKERQTAWDEAVGGLDGQLARIVSTDPDAVIVNLSFNVAKLQGESLNKYIHAMGALLEVRSEADPMNFEHRDKAGDVARILQQEVRLAQKPENGGQPRLTQDRLLQLADEHGHDPELVQHIGAIFNTQAMLFERPAWGFSRFVKGTEKRLVEDLKNRSDVPISLDYIGGILKRAHIVGQRAPVDSVTVGREIDVTALYDLHKVERDSVVQQGKESTAKRYGEISTALKGAFDSNPGDLSLKVGLLDAHASPQKLIKQAKEIPGFKDIFEADAGNWEQFTLAEHTESVLRNFEANYADNLPVEVLPLVKTALLVHDIGKSEAARERQPHKQHEFNKKLANDFLRHLRLDDRTTDLIQKLIGPAQKLTSDIIVRGKEEAIPALATLAAESLERFSGQKPSAEMIKAFVDISEIIQTCDSGAYTTSAVTRSDKNGYYRNHGSFNDSFLAPNDITRNRLVMKNGGISSRLPEDSALLAVASAQEVRRTTRPQFGVDENGWLTLL